MTDSHVATGASTGMGPLGWVIGGMIGGVIGATIWAAIAYFTQYEIGYIAIGVGFLVGLGVKIAAGDQISSTTGAVSAGIAILAVLAGKYFTIYLLMQNLVAGFNLDVLPIELNERSMVASLADQIIEEKQAAGETIDYPEMDEEAEEFTLEDQYPADILSAAKEQWNAKTPQEQAALTEARRAELAASMKEFKEQMGGIGNMMAINVFEGLDPIDYLFIGIAAWTAFSVGGRREEAAA